MTSNPAGTGPTTLNSGGTIKMSRISLDNPLVLNGGSISTQCYQTATMAGSVQLNAQIKFDMYNGDFEIYGPVSGRGGIYKVGIDSLMLRGINSSTGRTVVENGTLSCTAKGLGIGPLDIKSGGKVFLDFVGTRIITSLRYNGGTAMLPGTYGSSQSPATNQNDNFFTGKGTITILDTRAGLPVTSGLVLKLDASHIKGIPDGDQLDVWSDNSTEENDAIRQNKSSEGYPKYIADGINGKPAVRFNSPNQSAEDFLKFNRISKIRSVFWVFKENAGASDGHFLLGDSSNHHFHREAVPNGPLWHSSYSSQFIRTGTTKLMGKKIDGTTTPLPSGTYQLASLVTTGDVSADQLCQDRTFHGSWQGDIAEVLVYDRALSGTEEDQVGSYLSFKYGLATSYRALPVNNGLVLKMDASQITSVTDGSQLNTWTDTSGAGNHALRQTSSSAGYPKYVANGLNGQPVVRFDSSNPISGDHYKFNRISNIRSVFWVLREGSGLGDGHFLLGDDTSYDFHRGGSNGALWDANYSNLKVRSGVTRLMGSTVDGSATALPAGSFQVLSLITTDNVQANQICQDRMSHGSWQGDIAEILIYNRALSDPEEAAVGTYLAAKHRIAGNYPLPAIPAQPQAVTATTDGSGVIRMSWTPVLGVSTYKVSVRNTQTGVERIISNSVSPSLVGGLASGVAYEFKVAAGYANGITGDYSSPVSAMIADTTAFTTWAVGHGLTSAGNNSPTDDPDRDGISNLLEFVLGGAPMIHMRSILPVLIKVGNEWIFDYSRSDISQSIPQVVEYSNDLKSWFPIVIPLLSGNGVVITLGSPMDRVQVVIPTTVGKPTFIRLRAGP